jgi:hypothetical protein
MMSKSATEQVIEALKTVISDFNNNLTEQFGDNFKELNLAVKELVQWQENYKSQLLDMSTQYAEGVKSITQTEASVAHISEHTSEIPKTMQDLKTVMEVNQHQVGELESHLEAFKNIRAKAVEALPEIEKRIDETINGVQSATSKLSEGLEDSANKLSSAFIKTAEDFEDSSTVVNSSLQSTSDYLASNSASITQTLDDSTTQLSDDLNKLVTEFQKRGPEVVDIHKQGNEDIKGSYVEIGKALQDSMSGVQKEFQSQLESMVEVLKTKVESTISEQLNHTDAIRKNLTSFAEKSMTDTAEVVKSQTSMIDQALEKEINSSMQQLGSSLNSITQKFTKDYQVLVTEMQNVINTNRK